MPAKPPPVPYALTTAEHESYLHATVVGERTPANSIRFLKEAYAACVRAGKAAVLLETKLSGPSLGTTSIYQVISQGVPDALRLSRIAYVEASIDDAAMPYFAETVAKNRGVNVRLFRDVAAAQRWLRGESEAQ